MDSEKLKEIRQKRLILAEKVSLPFLEKMIVRQIEYQEEMHKSHEEFIRSLTEILNRRKQKNNRI
jgi:hypothetical protein